LSLLDKILAGAMSLALLAVILNKSDTTSQLIQTLGAAITAFIQGIMSPVSSQQSQAASPLSLGRALVGTANQGGAQVLSQGQGLII